MSSSGSVGRALTKSTDGIISRYINRKVSTRITAFLVKLPNPPSPDTVSIVSALVTALGALLIATGPMWLGGLLVQLGSILDGVDGEIARALKKQSKGGALFDTMLDRLADIAVITGLAAASIVKGYSTWIVVFASTLGLAGDLLVTYIHCIGEKLAGIHPVLVGQLPGIASRDVRLFIVFLASLVNAPLAALLAIAFLGFLYSLAKTIELLGYIMG
jgi:CDP-L-myo-inositol myo-inositolphosphotransferase